MDVTLKICFDFEELGLRMMLCPQGPRYQQQRLAIVAHFAYHPDHPTDPEERLAENNDFPQEAGLHTANWHTIVVVEGAVADSCTAAGGLGKHHTNSLKDWWLALEEDLERHLAVSCHTDSVAKRNAAAGHKEIDLVAAVHRALLHVAAVGCAELRRESQVSARPFAAARMVDLEAAVHKEVASVTEGFVRIHVGDALVDTD